MQKVNLSFPALLVLIFLSSFINHSAPKDKLQWLTLAEAEQKMKSEKKIILIDLYTDWCGWCKVMDKKTYANADVAKYLNEKFYPVKINAETKETLTWNGKPFQFNAQAGVNNYALYLTKGQLSFPSTVIIPRDGAAPQTIPGYIETKDMELVLKYFGEGNFEKVAFRDFQKNFISTWK
jgi:thioredoxin-related protein